MKGILHKIKRKGLNTLRKFIYYNHKYKPLKAYALSKDYFNENRQTIGLQFIELYPNYTTLLEVPENFLKAIPPYCLYDKKLPDTLSTLGVTTDYVIIALPNGRLYANNIDMVAVITQHNTLLGDVSLQYLLNRVARADENRIFKQNFFIPPKKYDGVVFNMLAGGGPVNNYGHWLVDVLPRIHLLKKSGWFDKVNWFVVPNYTHDFQKDSLKLLGITEDKIIQGTEQLHITADVLIASSAPRGVRSYLMPKWLVDFHRESFLNFKIKNFEFSPFVYISRRDGTTRKVLNEQKLIDMLEKYNFKVIELSDFSFVEKISIFDSAKVIVSVVGAALSNVVFCKKGTKVLEIFPELLVDTFDYNLAEQVGVEYNYLICKSEKKANQVLKATNTDMTVDLIEVEKIVKILCNQATNRDIV
jgi:hypothetical protein